MKDNYYEIIIKHHLINHRRVNLLIKYYVLLLMINLFILIINIYKTS